MAEPYYTVESLQPLSSVGFLIKRCGILMIRIAEREFAALPISVVQWQILMMLSQQSHSSPTELSEYLGHDMGALTRTVDELEQKALVRRERSRHDRRAVEIAITAEGRRLSLMGKRVIVDLLNQLLEPYTKGEVDVLISLLQKLMLHMQTLARAGTPAESTAEGPRAARKEPRRKHLP